MRIYDLLNQEVYVEENFCFVIMPFDEKLKGTYERVIEPIVKELEFRCERADQSFESVPIILEIFENILRARVIIADLTDNNKNVFYELGICHALKKNVILLNQAESDVPFDIRGVRYQEYENQPGWEDRLQGRLKKALQVIMDRNDDEPYNVKSMIKNMKNGCHLWKSGKKILIKLEEFSEIVIGLNHLSPTEEEIAFLCNVAAYYGMFMKKMTSVAQTNMIAIHTLTVEAASGSFTRVPWRASLMLEHLSRDLVISELKNFTGDVTNTHIFPEAILEESTVTLLIAMIDNPETSAGIREKLTEVLKQIRSEFGRD